MIFQPEGNIHVLNSAGVYLLKVNYEYDRRNRGICSKLTIKTIELRQMTPLCYLLALVRFRSSHLRCFIKKAVCNNFAIFTISALQLYQKETPTLVLSCEHCKIFKNTYFEKHLPTAASVDCKKFCSTTESQIEVK